MNKKRLLELADHLDEVAPETFDMREWCGTACCIGGHACILYGTGSLGDDPWDLLELDHRGDELFMPDSRIVDYKEVDPKKAARVLRKLAQTGRVDWNIA